MNSQERVIELLITGYSHDGKGVGRYAGKPVFVAGALRGELVRVEFGRERKGIINGQLLEIIEAAPERVTPVCSVFSSCGGCQLQHLDYQAQLQMKREIVSNALQRIGGFKDIDVHLTLGMAEPWAYRNKGHFRVSKAEGNISLGFYEEASHKQVQESCRHLFSQAVVELLDSLPDLLEQHQVPIASDVDAGIRHIMVRESSSRGEILMVLILSEPLNYDFSAIAREICKNNPRVVGVCTNINPRKAGPILGRDIEIVYGKGELLDTIGPYTFRISPHSFFQVNNHQTEVLYSKALEYAALKGEELVVDAYCGIGTISLYLANQAKKVIGVEVVAEAIQDAEENARLNKVSNVEFIQGEAEKVLPELVEKGLQPQVVVVDPPRKGCGQPLLDSILQVKPERLVYVSCNPATLARDLKHLATGGYQVQEVQPVDMFPQTGHVECCVLMSRVKD